MEYKGIEIGWLHHDCFRIAGGGLILYTDPYKVERSYNDGDVILITHDHYDHCNPESIKKLVKDETVIVAPKDCEEKLSEFKQKKVFVSPNEVKIVRGVSIRTVRSYNLNKFRAPGEVFHPKEKGNVGYVFTISGVKFYIAGDTDAIPEMKDIKADVAFLPVSGIYVMTSDEAAEAALTIKPDLAVPMHYGSGIGTEKDALNFADKLKGRIKVEILRTIEG
ncbi:MAG: MBL fold metallo-hydrolase [Candidatus Parvarchaeota archaeon]|nr:MBL fold metallo-hydrolase [Candidatus Parvarchaeota archaeon]MCW1301933.1 MBL fold metallo-hydrolase [Candidatus Parvarchaeota archaeon]